MANGNKGRRVTATTTTEPEVKEEQDTGKTVLVTNAFQGFALSFAQDVAKDEQTNNDLRKYGDAKRYLNIAPVLVFGDLKSVLGDEKFGALPSVSDANDGTQVEGLNNPYKKKLTIGGKETTLDFYNIFVMEGLPAGQEIGHALDQIALASDLETVAQAEEPYKFYKHGRLRAEERKWKQRKTSLVGVVKRVIQIRDQIALIKSELPQVMVQFVEEKNGDLADVTEPFIVRNADLVKAPDEYDTYTVGQFLGLKPLIAKANGGSYDALSKTIGGKKKAGENELPEIASIAILDQYVAALANVIGDKGWYRELLNHMTKGKAEDTDDLLQSLVTIRDNIDHLLTNKKLSERVEAMTEGYDEDEKAA